MKRLISILILCTAGFFLLTTSSAENTAPAPVPVKVFKAEPANIRLNVGETATAGYVMEPEDATDRSLIWSSENEEIVRVDENGTLTGVAPGTAKVKAETRDGSGKSAVFTVHVPTLVIGETDYSITEVFGLTIPFTYWGDDFEKNVSVRTSGKHVTYDMTCDGCQAELHLTATDVGYTTVEIADKMDGKAKLTLNVRTLKRAIPFHSWLEITSLNLQNNANGLSVRIGGKNHTERRIAKVSYALDFRTESGEQRFFPGTFDGHDIPSLGQIWTSSWQINAGSSSGCTCNPSTGGQNILDGEITEVRCAIDTIEFSNGSYIRIPDSQKYWFSSVSGYLEKPELKKNYVMYDSSFLDKAKSAEIGFLSTKAHVFELPWYGSEEAGEYVTHIDPDSIAEKCGLQLKDIIFEADGIRFDDDPCFLTRGEAKTADGESVIFRVIRAGEVVELTIHP